MASQILLIDSASKSGSRNGSGLFEDATWLSLAQSLGLSRRELQILQRIFDDQTESVIAKSLEISPHTVNTYVQRLYQKLGVASRAQAIVFVVKRYFDSDEARLKRQHSALA